MQQVCFFPLTLWFSAKKKKKHGSGDAHKTFEDKTRLDLSSTILLCTAMPQRCGLLPWTRVITGLKPYTQIPSNLSTEREELLSGSIHCYTAGCTDKAELNHFHLSILSIIKDHLGVGL